MHAGQLSGTEHELPAFDLGPDGFPRPGQVIRHFRQLKLRADGKPWTQRDLARALGKQELTVRDMELRDAGLDTITRRRLLAELLDIPLILFGLATVPENQRAESAGLTWWVQQGFPAFSAGPDNFPHPGQVLRYFRKAKLKADGKPWTQRDLAQVLGTQELAIREMELRDAGLNDISRRRLLAELFAIPPILLGLAEAPQRATARPAVSLGKMSRRIDLALYERQLHTCYTTHHRRASYEQTSAIQQTIASLYQALPFSHEKEIWQLTSRYHILIASILRDQHFFREALEHLDQAIFLTEYIGDNEFLADALYRQGWVYLERREGEKAAQSFLSAERLLKKLPSYMGGGILIGLGRSLALQTQDMQERLTALHTLDKAAHLLRLYPLPDGNQHYLEIELDRYHLDKAAAFLDIGFPREALRELSLVRSSPHNQRRAAMISVFQAQANVALGKYAEACDLAEEALDLIGPIRSVVNYERIQMLYQELQLTSFRNNPEVARLGVMLHQIQMCWHGKNKQRNRL
jgi:tetratricopeptide (TPR) repeat protein